MVIGVCDDERSYQEAVVLHAQKWQKERHPDLVLSVKCYETAEALANDWESGIHFDLLFLDIRLPFSSGLQLAANIRKADPYVPIVFITNYNQYAQKGYEVNAFRYLSKPLSENQMNICLEHTHSLLFPSAQPQLLATRDGVQVRISPQNIVSISCNHHHALITVAETPKPYSVRISGGFDEFLSTIPAPFFIRCHNSHVINSMYIAGLTRTNIQMLNGQVIPISRAFKNQVLMQLHTHASRGLM